MTARDLACTEAAVEGAVRWWPEGTEPTKPLEAYEAQLLMVAGDFSRVKAAPMWRPVNAAR